MKGMADEDLLSKRPPRSPMTEERVFTIFEAVQRHPDFIVARSIAAFEEISRIDRCLHELSRLHEAFNMALLPEGGLKWKVLKGRAKMGKEMVAIASLCRGLCDSLVALCKSTCGFNGFRRAGQIAGEQLRKLTAGTFRKPFERDIWVPENAQLPKYLEDDEWFRGLAESLSGAMLSLLSSAIVLRGAFMDEFELLFSSTGQRIEELEKAGIPAPLELRRYTDQYEVDRQRKIFSAVALPAAEDILVKHLTGIGMFSTCADAILEIRDELESMVRRLVAYQDFSDLKLAFPHGALDVYIGYVSPQDRLEEEKSFLLRHVSGKKPQLEAQKSYYLVKLWGMTPDLVERTRQNVARERECFYKEEMAIKPALAETIKLLKGSRREHADALRALEHFDRENDLAIAALPSDIDIRMKDGELVELLGALKKCIQVRKDEYMALCGKMKEETFRARPAMEVSKLPDEKRHMLLDAVGEFGDIQPIWGGPYFTERYHNTVEHYRALLVARKRLGELCVRVVQDDLKARCAELVRQDKWYADYSATVLRRFGLAANYRTGALEDVFLRCDRALELIFKEEEKIILGLRQAVLGNARSCMERAERTIIPDEMVKKLGRIEGFAPARPASLTEEAETLERLGRELSTRDLMADAQHYWIRVRELCEVISSSISIHLDASMTVVEERAAGAEAVLDKLYARQLLLVQAIENRLGQIDAILEKVPELGELKLSTRFGPDLRGGADDGRNLPGLRLQNLERVGKAARVGREKAIRIFLELKRRSEDLSMPGEFVSRLGALADMNLDAAAALFASLRMEVRNWLGTTMQGAIAGLDMPSSGKWDLPEGATMDSWLGTFGDFLEKAGEKARSTIDEAAGLLDKLARSEEANLLRKKTIARCPMGDLLRASDSEGMKEVAFLLFDAEPEMEAVRRGIEQAVRKKDPQGVAGGVQRWKLLRKRLREVAFLRTGPGGTPLIEALRDLDDRRLREFDLSKNRDRFPDRAFIEDLERAIVRYRNRDRRIPVKDFNRLLTALRKEGQAGWADYSDELLMTAGEHQAYRLTVARPERPGGATACTVRDGDVCVEFTYEPRRMLLVLREK